MCIRDRLDSEYICVLNKLISIGVDGKEPQVVMDPNFFKNTYVFKKGGILSTMILLRLKRCPYLARVMKFGNDASGRKDLRTNPSDEGAFEWSKNSNHSPKVDSVHNSYW